MVTSDFEHGSLSAGYIDAINRVAPAAICVLDLRAGTYVFVNDALEALLGYPKERVLAEGMAFIGSLVHPDDFDTLMARNMELLETLDVAPATPGPEPVFEFEYRMRAADGQWRHVRTLGTVYQRDADRKIRYIINASIDVTQLKNAVRFRDEFLSIASHELKTPLTPLKLQLELINQLVRGNHVLTGESRELLGQMTRIAEQQVDRLTELVNELLDVTRVTTGRLSLNLEECDLGRLVSAVADRYRNQADSQGCTLRLSIGHKVIGRFDHLRLEQVVVNLLTNALKYAPRAPIDIEVVADAHHAQLRVRDHGPGIAAEHLESIFNRFERVSPSGPGGLGLGLFICRQIARRHGGDILLHSEAGRGSSFTVLLPLRAELS